MTGRNKTAYITTIIPCYNGMKYLPACIKSIAAQTVESELIVVDNGSEDSSLAFLESILKKTADDHADYGTLPERMKVISLGENTGFANAVNVGIMAAETPYVFLLNDDTVMEEDALMRLYDTIRRSRRIFSVGAKLLSMNKEQTIDDCGDLTCALGWSFSPGRDRDKNDYSKKTSVTSACAGGALYRRDLVMRLGGFDSEHFCYLEDVDLGIRARLYGFVNLYEPAAVIHHAASATSGSRYNAFKEELTAANSIYLMYKNLPPFMLFINLPLIVTGHLIKLLWFTGKGLGKPYLKGIADGLKKCRDNPDRRLPFNANRLTYYLRLQLDLLINCARRITG